jgi:hypothetical protein
MDKERLQQLIDQLKSGNDRQRRAASYRLGQSNDQDAVPALISAYNDKDGLVRQNVIAGLKNIASKDAIDFLTSIKIPSYIAPQKQQFAYLIILVVSLLSAPFFDFFSYFIGLVPFVNGGCGGMLVSPILALIISLFTGGLGLVLTKYVLKIEKYLVLIGLLCGLFAGILAALIFAPEAC